VCGYSLGDSVRSSLCQWERQANLNPYWMGCGGVEGPSQGTNLAISLGLGQIGEAAGV